MRRAFVWAALAVVVPACAVGPSPDVPPMPAPSLTTTSAPPSQLLDSLISQSVDAAAATPLPSPPTELGWLSVLKDTALVSLVRTAVANNKDLAVATARVREFRGNRAQAAGPLLPEIDASGAAARNQQIFGSLGAFKFDALTANATASWELDFWGRVRRGAQAAGFDLNSTEQGRRAVELSLIAAVADAYLELRELDADLSISRRTLDSRQSTLRLARSRFAQGVISELDVRQFEAEVATAASAVALFTQARAQQESFLSVLLGQAPGPIPRGGPLETSVQAVSVPDSLPGTLLLGRPDVMGARYDWSAALSRLGAAESARLPRFVVSGLYGTQSTTWGGLFGPGSNVYSFQVGVSMPVFTGGRLLGAQAAASARADEARLYYERTVLQALREGSDALASVRLTRDALAAQESQARALRRAVELAERRYQSGVSSILEVLDAERGQFTAELALVQAERRYLESTVQLYKVMGGSWAN